MVGALTLREGGGGRRTRGGRIPIRPFEASGIIVKPFEDATGGGSCCAQLPRLPRVHCSTALSLAVAVSVVFLHVRFPADSRQPEGLLWLPLQAIAIAIQSALLLSSIRCGEVSSGSGCRFRPLAVAILSALLLPG